MFRWKLDAQARQCPERKVTDKKLEEPNLPRRKPNAALMKWKARMISYTVMNTESWWPVMSRSNCR